MPETPVHHYSFVWQFVVLDRVEAPEKMQLHHFKFATKVEQVAPPFLGNA